jgi:hypothetical protein
MCATAVGLSKPLNETLTVIIRVTVSTVTNALPMPGDPVCGTSCAPVSVAVNANWSAFATPDNAATAATRARRLSVFFIIHLFLSLKGHAAPQRSKSARPGKTELHKERKLTQETSRPGGFNVEMRRIFEIRGEVNGANCLIKNTRN